MADRMITYALGVLTGIVGTVVACFAIVGYRHTPPPSFPPPFVMVPCWCHRNDVMVRREYAAHGATNSCGRTDCLGPRGFTNA